MDLAALFSPIVKVGTAVAGVLAKPFEWGATLGKELGGSLKAPETFNLNVVPKATTISAITPANSVTRDTFWSGLTKGVQGSFEKLAQIIVNPLTPLNEAAVKSGVAASNQAISSVYATGAKAVSNNILGNFDQLVGKIGNTVTNIATIYKNAADILRGTVAQSTQDASTGIKILGGSPTDNLQIPLSLLPLILTQRDTGSTSGDLASSLLGNLFANTNPVKEGTAAPQPLENTFSFGGISPTVLIIIAALIIMMLFMKRNA